MSNPPSLTEHLFREKYGEILATLLRSSGYEHMDLAEEAVQFAFQRALEKWLTGLPKNPGGWLYTVAKNAFLESLRRGKTEQQKYEQIQHETELFESHSYFELEEALDDLAAMILLCCNPELNPKSQVCITLKSACGFSVKEIARALGMQEEATKKIITRAKEKIEEDHDVFQELDQERIAERFTLVLETLYAMFTEGYSASGGETQLRKDVAEDAIRLANVFLQTKLTPVERRGEIHALIALMLLQFARFAARADEAGLPIRLQEQDRSKWNQGMVHAGLLALKESQASPRPSVFHLEARLAAEHATSPSFEGTNWKSILKLYDELLLLKDTPEVRTSRIVSVKYAEGWEPALAELEALESALKSQKAMTVPRSFLIHAVRADILEAAGKREEASKEWREAKKDAPTQADQDFVQKKLDEFS
jgi:RNA polymerase sigma-70 factor (ECF subfamily)